MVNARESERTKNGRALAKYQRQTTFNYRFGKLSPIHIGIVLVIQLHRGWWMVIQIARGDSAFRFGRVSVC